MFLCFGNFCTVNKWIAKEVADATRSMMKQKDERYTILGFDRQEHHQYYFPTCTWVIELMIVN